MTNLDEAFANLAKSLIANRKTSHTMVVITATSVLDAGLQACLEVTFRPLNKKALKNLFEGHGPLSSFSAKIDIAYALRVIDNESSVELHKLRRMRNDFAHSHQRLSLEDEPMLSQFMALKRTTGGPGISHSQVFMDCVSTLNGILMAHCEKVKT